MEDTDLMPIGKFKGEQLINVPASYLMWLHDEHKDNIGAELVEYIKDNWSVLEVEAKRSRGVFNYEEI